MTTTLDEKTFQIYQNVVRNPKVPMTLRMGIAGPRYLSSQALITATQTLSEVSATIAKTLIGYIQENTIAKTLYDVENHKQPILRLTSSLAIGVDRLSMSCVVSDRLKDLVICEYAGVLPFLLDQCKEGFCDEKRSAEQRDEDWHELNALVEQIKQQSKTRLIELDGDIKSPESRDKAHLRCAEFLIENIDLLFIITEQEPSLKPPHHQAGTLTTMRLAKEAGLPAIEIVLNKHNETPEIHLHQAKRFGRNETSERFSDINLMRMLSRVVLFGSLFKLDESRPSGCIKQRVSHEDKQKQLALISHGMNDHISDKSKLAVTNSIENAVDFDYRGPINSPTTLLDKCRGDKAFEWFIRIMSNQSAIKETKEQMQQADIASISAEEKERPGNIPEAHQWFAHFSRSDAIAIRYAAIHRSTYLLIYLFAALALLVAALALTLQSYPGVVFILILLEALILFLIYRLYKKDHHNQQKWLQNRCLAEAIRPNIYLSQFGRCFSFFNIRSSDEFAYREIMGHNETGAQWVCIQAELINRHLGFNHCRYTQDCLKQDLVFLKSKWVCGQINYHLANAAKMQIIGKRFTKITHRLFTLTCLALIAKGILFGLKPYTEYASIVGSIMGGIYKVVSWGTAALPIAGTAMFAIRHHSEFDISAQRSLTMLAFFRSIRNAIEAKQDDPNQNLDTVFNRLTEVSAKEVSDWLEIYEVKESEPG